MPHLKIEGTTAAEQVFAEVAVPVAQRNCFVQHARRVRVLRAQVDIALRCADCEPGNGHPLNQAERVALHQHAIGKRAGIAFVGVAHDVFLSAVRVEHRIPFDARRECGAATSAKSRHLYLLDDVRRRQIQRAIQTPEALMLQVVVEVDRISDADARERQPFLGPKYRTARVGPTRRAWGSPLQEIGIEQDQDVGRHDRAVRDSAVRGMHFDQRLQPAHAA